jgi:hypothetical protein
MSNTGLDLNLCIPRFSQQSGRLCLQLLRQKLARDKPRDITGRPTHLGQHGERPAGRDRRHDASIEIDDLPVARRSNPTALQAAKSLMSLPLIYVADPINRPIAPSPDKVDVGLSVAS